jgi:hypothetical protein
MFSSAKVLEDAFERAEWLMLMDYYCAQAMRESDETEAHWRSLSPEERERLRRLDVGIEVYLRVFGDRFREGEALA